MEGETARPQAPGPDLDALLARSGDAAFDRLIYLFGNARGGTSFLRSIFDLHPGVLAFDGPTHFLNHVWRHRRKVADRLWRLIFWMPFFAQRQRIRKTAPEQARGRFEAAINKALSSHELARIYRCYPMIRAADPEGGINLQAIHAWVDKGNDCWGINALAEAFPEGRFVAVVRDPRAAIASLAGRLAGRRTGSPSAKERADVIAAAIYWTNVTQTSLRFARRHRGRAALVRYEDIVLEPVETVRALYDAAGLPALSDTDLREQLAGIHYGASMDAAELGTGVNRAPLTRWRESLDAESLALIAAICGPTARLFGYAIAAPDAPQGHWRMSMRMGGGKASALALAKLGYLRARTPRGIEGAPTIGAFDRLDI